MPHTTFGFCMYATLVDASSSLSTKHFLAIKRFHRSTLSSPCSWDTKREKEGILHDSLWHSRMRVLYPSLQLLMDIV